MEKLSFKATFNAPRTRVWNILWNEKTYLEWTSVFAPGSTLKTDWKEGNKILFLDEKGDGMVSRIAKKKENEFMSFEHLGEVHKGVEDVTSDRAKAWSGAFENYTLKETNGMTELVVDINVTDEFKGYFAETWPQALEKLRTIVESKRELVV